MPDLPALRHHRACSVFQHRHRRWLLTAVVTFTYPALATATEGLSEADYLEDIPVVLSAARLAQPVTEAPAAVTVIDRAMIEASGARQIVDLFRLVPGFTVGSINGYNSSVTYHGIADEYSRRMQVLIDGRSVYLPSIGGVAWADLPITLADIDRIEVIRGPDSASYGANSFLGVISISTRHATEDKGSSVRLAYGQHDIRDGELRHGGGSGPFAYHLTLGQRADNGFDNRHDSQRVRLFNSRIEYQLGVNDYLEMQFGLSSGAEQAGSIFLTSTNINLDPPHIKTVNSHFEQLHWLHSGAPGHEYSLRFYHDYHNTNEDYQTDPVALLGGTRIPISTDILAERYDLEFQGTDTPQPNLRLVWGASARQDQVTAPTFFATARRLNSALYRLFGNLEWHITPTLVSNVGAMQEHTDITGSKLSPRLALNYHVTEHQTVRAVVSSATRTPILFEEQANLKFVAGPYTDQIALSTVHLDSERIDAHELGYLLYWPERGTSLDVKIFHDLLRDIIRAEKVCQTGDPAYVACVSRNKSNGIDTVDGNYNHFRNADHVAVHGLEFQIDQRFGATTRIVAGYAHTRITGHGSDPALFRSAPVDSYHLLLIEQFPQDTTASLAYYQFGDMQYLDFGNHTAAQHRLDLRLAHTLRHDDNRISLALTVQNLLGSYQDFYYNKDLKNLFDRRAFVELAWQLP